MIHLLAATLDIDAAVIISAIGGISTAVWIVSKIHVMALSTKEVLREQMRLVHKETGYLRDTLNKLNITMANLNRKIEDHSHRIEKLESSLEINTPSKKQN